MKTTNEQTKGAQNATRVLVSDSKSMANKKTVKTAKVATVEKSANYRTSDDMAKARLFNVRKLDCVFVKGAKIAKGAIVEGTHGVAVAEIDVQGVKASKVVSFKATGEITHNGKQFAAMVRENADGSAKNYVVAQGTFKGKKVCFNVEVEKGASYRQLDKRAEVIA